jgi:cellulose synthase/poly-beta-1,6-N-acetylglucosamine synthase-like glycosyltransferase
MNSILLYSYLAVALVALVSSFVLLLQTWEHRRYTRNKLRQSGNEHGLGEHVAVIVPCKGLDLKLEDNLRRLMSQDHPSYEVIFVVDSDDDPACELIGRVMADGGSVPARLVNAGRATDTGQKIHNLLAATAELDPRVDILAFVDSDARPSRDWLRNLISNLNRPGFDAVTSYRWFVPQRVSLGNLIMFSLNSAVMGMTATRRRTVLWGGTWAIRRETFQRSGLPEVWRGRLSDDLVASALLDKLRIRVSFEPRCIVISPIDYGISPMWEFLRRQMYMGRWYRARTWWMCFAVMSAGVAAFWGGVAMWMLGLRSGAWWSSIPAATVVALYGFAMLRARWRQQAGELYACESSPALRAAKWFDLFSFPLTSLIAWAGMLTSVAKRRTTWRGIEYRMGRDGRVEIINRAEAEASAAAQPPQRHAA